MREITHRQNSKQDKCDINKITILRWMTKYLRIIDQETNERMEKSGRIIEYNERKIPGKKTTIILG